MTWIRTPDGPNADMNENVMCSESATASAIVQ